MWKVSYCISCSWWWLYRQSFVDIIMPSLLGPTGRLWTVGRELTDPEETLIFTFCKCAVYVGGFCMRGIFTWKNCSWPSFHVDTVADAFGEGVSGIRIGLDPSSMYVVC
jgi:hypothetical protein